MDLAKISVTVLAKNSQKHITEVLTALAPFGEVLLYDTGSSDRTMEIGRTFANVTVKQGEFVGFGATHNSASASAKHDWILSIDSDEIATSELVEALRAEELDPAAVYLFPRHNYFAGRWIRGCGWYPDRQIKLYHRKHTQFTADKVHEAVEAQHMQLVLIDAPLVHYSYDSIADFLTKMQFYSTLFAEQNRGKKRSSPLIAVSHALFAFVKSYLFKRGFLDGYQGFVISAYNAHTAFYKYLKLYEANNDQ